MGTDLFIQQENKKDTPIYLIYLPPPFHYYLGHRVMLQIHGKRKKGNQWEINGVRLD